MPNGRTDFNETTHIHVILAWWGGGGRLWLWNYHLPVIFNTKTSQLVKGRFCEISHIEGMFANDVVHLLLWWLKGLCLRDYIFITPPKKRLVTGTRTSTTEGPRQSS